MAFYSALLDRKLSLNIILHPLLRAGHILRRMLQDPCLDTKNLEYGVVIYGFRYDVLLGTIVPRLCASIVCAKSEWN
jgi:hypothetical protein